MTKKRLFVLLVTFVMLCTMSCVTYAENSEVTPTAEERAVEVLDTDEFNALYAMGFLGDELLNSDKNKLITRAQFTGYLFKIAGYSLNEYKTDTIPFGDVNTTTPYYNEICTMYEMGKVNGTEPNRFSPEAHVTYAQACKLITDVLGYRNYAEVKYGDSLESYIMIAGELEIGKGVKNVVWNSELTAEDAVRMLYNAGKTEVVSFSGVDKFGNPTYGKDGATLFEKNNIYYDEGKMQSNGICAITAEDPTEGVTIINDVRYVSADCDFSKLIGCKIKYFYRDDKYSKKLLYAMLDKRYTTMIDVKAEDLATADPGYSLTNIVYYESNGKTENALISPTAFVIYNNSRCGIPSIDDFKPMTGTMRLIDNDDDKIYDVVIVEEYQNIFVRQTSSDNNTIIGKNSKTLDLEKYNTVKIYRDGEEIESSDIGSNVVISYIENKDKTKIYLYVSSTMNNGKIVSSRVVRGRTFYTFESGEYMLCDTYTKLLNNTDIYVINPKIGRNYKFWLDMAGEIAEFEEFGTNMQYALLMSVREGEVYEDGDVYARILMPDNSKVSGVIKKKITVNGETKTAAQFFANENLKDANGNFKVQVVQVAFNEDGILTKIDFATDSTRTDSEGNKLFPYGYDPTSFSLDHSGTTSVKNTDGYVMCDYRYFIGNETLVFIKWLDEESAEPYEVKTKTHMTEGDYAADIYDISENYVAAAVYRSSGFYRKSSNTADMLVSDVDYVYENDQEVMRISGYVSGGYTSVTEYEPGMIDVDVKRGDLIEIARWDGKIAKVTVKVTKEEFINKTSKVINEASGGGIWSKETTIFAPLYSTSTYGFSMLTPPEWISKYGPVITSGRGSDAIPVIVYDMANDEMYVGDVYDVYQMYTPDASGELPLEDNSVMVYLKMRYVTMKEIIVVKY